MPFYDYECRHCGPFTALRPMARFREAGTCPVCGGDAGRADLSAPAIGGGRACQEAGAAPSRQAAAHPAGCGCCMRRAPLPAAWSAGGRVFTSHWPVAGGRRPAAGMILNERRDGDG